MTEQRSVNRIISLLYAVVSIILIAAYILEVAKGVRDVVYLLILVLILIIPGIINAVYQIKNHETKETKYILTAGYLCMYAFVLVTATSSITFS